MSLLFVDSFDHYATADLLTKWTTGGGSSVIGGSGRFSTNCLQLLSTETVAKTLAASGGTCIVGMAIYVTPSLVSAGSVRGQLLTINDGATTQVSVYINTTGVLEVYRGTSGGTLLGASTFAIAAATFYYIEFKVVIHPSAGSFELRVDGSSKLSGSGINTRSSSANQWGQIKIAGAGASGGGSPQVRFDDFYACDGAGTTNNDFLGDVRIVRLLPDTGNGTNTGLTPSTGADHGALVREATPNGDTNYNSSASASAKDTYNFPALGVTGTIFGVQVCLSVKKDDAGAKTAAPVYRVSGTDYDGGTQSLGTTYTYLREITEISPATSVAWTVSEIDASEFGMKVVA